MDVQELLENMEENANDFMVLATQLSGAESGLAAECSQRLKDLHATFKDRFWAAGMIEE